MKDTLETDFAAMAREYWLCLGKADRLRWLDARIRECGGAEAPIPEFVDTREDARHWAFSCLPEVQKIYLAAIWVAMSDKDQDAFDRWRAKNKEAEKAEALGG